MKNLPFKEVIENSKVRVRSFSPDIDESELKWHYDLEDRTIIPLNINDWKIQKDNCLPEEINKTLFIKAKEWHRVIKGKTELLVKIIFN